MSRTRLRVRLLLDTGPTVEETDQIETVFRGLGMDADVEGHSYGGPPPTSAFLIVVNAPLMPLLDTFAVDGPAGGRRFVDWARQLLALRSDERKWGRQHTLKLEDAHGSLGVLLPPQLPDGAFREVLDIDLGGFDQNSPPVTVEWSDRLRRWQARPHAIPRQIARRLANRRLPLEETFRTREISDAETRELWRLTEDPTSHAVTWQRARIVLSSSVGWSVGAIAANLMVSADRVRCAIQNFNADGFTSLDPGYSCGRPIELRAEEERETKAIAARHPSDYGLPLAAWNPETLADFLVSEGVVEDVSASQLADLPGVRDR